MKALPNKIPVILCIDAEPDPFLVNRADPEPWLGYEGTHRYFAELRPRLEEATGSSVHYTWCFRLDPQIAESYGSPTFVVDRYPGMIREIVERKDEIAAHPHMYRWERSGQKWIDDLGNQAWVTECTEMSLEAFSRAFGRPCSTHRGGNFWINTETVNLLEQRGVRFDLTVEPGLPWHRRGSLGKEHATGTFPDYCRVPREPYEPSHVDFLRRETRGSRTIRMVPLTSGSLRRVGLKARWQRLRENGFRHRLQNVPLSMWKDWQAPNTFEVLLDRALARQARPYLAFAVRSCLGIGRAFEPIDRALRTLAAHRERGRFVFCSPAEATKILSTSEDAA